MGRCRKSCNDLLVNGELLSVEGGEELLGSGSSGLRAIKERVEKKCPQTPLHSNGLKRTLTGF